MSELHDAVAEAIRRAFSPADTARRVADAFEAHDATFDRARFIKAALDFGLDEMSGDDQE